MPRTRASLPPLRPTVALLLALAAARPHPGCTAQFLPSKLDPPEIPREFRGAWIATVHNLDWPSSPGLSASRQKAELVALLDRAAQIGLNAILLQVRPACDALYASRIEPWSPFLTGTMGAPPSPAYDPLEFAVAEAHRRGLELHAWFNPFRARASEKTSLSSGHIARRQPELARSYGSLLWLDPGDARARQHATSVILDVARRYDVDGIHLDDYFYPYPVKGRDGKMIPFPDDATYRAYRGGGGGLDRESWRIQNINRFVENLHGAIRGAKPWIRFGISPFGIWRPGNPRGIEAGIDAPRDLGSDARAWLRSRSVDYLAPQLYWPTSSKEQNFTALLDWWNHQSPDAIPLWPGIATERVGRDRIAGEILRQIDLVRARSNTPGHIHWNLKPLIADRKGVASQLARSTYATRALTPPCPAVASSTPGAPAIECSREAREAKLVFRWTTKNPDAIRFYAVQSRSGKRWSTLVLGAAKGGISYPIDAPPDAIAVRAVDRGGRVGPATTLARP